MDKEPHHLLLRFTREHCEQSFTRLVEHFSGLVFSTALRCVKGDHELAKDVTQIVFIDLAQKAKSFQKSLFLAGWLHRHTFFVASKKVRSERRRKIKESQAIHAVMKGNDGSHRFENLAPVLDEAVNRLNDRDRKVILLRFFQDMNYQEIGLAIGASEDAARMRAKRALSKLINLFEKRGITIKSAAVAAMLSANAVQTAPMLNPSILSKTAISTAASGSGIFLCLKNMFTLTPIKSGLAATAITAAVIIPTTVVHENRNIQQLMQDHRAQIEILETNNDLLKQQIILLNKESKIPHDDFRELLRLRGEVGVLRTQVRSLEGANHSLNDSLAQMSTQLPSKPPRIETIPESPVEVEWVRVKVDRFGNIFLNGDLTSIAEFERQCLDFKQRVDMARIFFDQGADDYPLDSEYGTTVLAVTSALTEANIGLSAALSDEELASLPAIELDTILSLENVMAGNGDSGIFPAEIRSGVRSDLLEQ